MVALVLSSPASPSGNHRHQHHRRRWQQPLCAAVYHKKLLFLSRCKTINHVRLIHADLLKTGQLHDPCISRALLERLVFSFPDEMHYAATIFRHIENRETDHYNVMMRGYTFRNFSRESVDLFVEMLQESVDPDVHSVSCVLKASSRLFSIRLGRGIHGLALKKGTDRITFVRVTMMHMYAKCGHIASARKLFDKMPERNVIAWNSMFTGYAKYGDRDEVARLFIEMIDAEAVPDEVSIICVLTACSRLKYLELGECAHCYVGEVGMKLSRNLETALVDMYAKCGRIEIARMLFDAMPERDVIAWSAMISGYNQLGQCNEALSLFNEMQIANVSPNEVTMVSVLSSCASLGALENGKWAHRYVQKKLPLTLTLGTALIDFYAKCGSVDNALKVFNEMPNRNVLSWSAIIQGLANNGQGKEALLMFSQMKEENVEPNNVTFVAVLSACSHAGLVNQGWKFFHSMRKDYGIKPRIEHYGCMVDILGRAGLIQKAYHFIENMPIHPNVVVWRTLLSACRIHGNLQMAEVALKNLVEFEPKHSGDIILLSSIYASVGRWEDSARLRTEMKKKGIQKEPGCSLIEVDGVIHEFFAEDTVHPESKEIYAAAADMMNKLKLAGYVPITSEARLDADEVEKEASVSHHSERLAIVFGLIRTSPGTTIRISKNLRVCRDCHYATKLISKIFNREIVVRDRHRFHHFRNGSCSCSDYW